MLISLVIFLYAIWTSCFALGKYTLTACPPVFLTGARMLLGGLVIMIILYFTGKKGEGKIERKNIIPLILLGILSIYLTNICEFWALSTSLTAAKVCFIYGLSPFIAALLSYIHFKERMSLRKWVGMGIGFVGVLLGIGGTKDLFNSVSLAELAMVGAAFFSVYGWVLLRILVKDSALSPLNANGYSMLIGGTMAIIHSFFIDTWTPTPIIAGHFSTFLTGVVAMTLISNIICYNLYGYLLKKFTATFMSFMGLLSPFFASFTAWLIVGEKPQWEIFYSSAVIILGLWIVYKEELKQGYIKNKEAPKEAIT
jgi:drug/metabolite transporter (DMT)-like permease